MLPLLPLPYLQEEKSDEDQRSTVMAIHRALCANEEKGFLPVMSTDRVAHSMAAAVAAASTRAPSPSLSLTSLDAACSLAKSNGRVATARANFTRRASRSHSYFPPPSRSWAAALPRWKAAWPVDQKAQP